MKYLVDLDLNKQELLNAVVQNLSAAPASAIEGQIYYDTGEKSLFQYDGTNWVNLSNIYEHPTFTAYNFDSTELGGAKVLGTFETNEEGHVIAASTRTLSLAQLGFTGDTDANNYVHPTITIQDDIVAPLEGATVISDVNVNSEGHVTGFVTRNLTAADLSFLIDDLATATGTTWSSQKIADELASINSNITGALIYQGGYDAEQDSPALAGTTSGIEKGYTYTVTVGGSFNGQDVQIGDMIIAEIDDPSGINDWTVVNKNIPDIIAASESAAGIIKIANQTEVDEGTNDAKAVTPLKLATYVNAQNDANNFAADFGDGTANQFDIVHNFGTKDVIVEIFDNSTGETVIVDILRFDNNTVRLTTNTTPTTDQYRVVVRKI